MCLESEAVKREAARLAILDELSIMGTAPERDFDDLTELAAIICGTPVSLISLVGADRQFFKSARDLDLKQTPREWSFCFHAMGLKQTVVIGDATQDDRFRDNPLVTGDPNIRFYAGSPIYCDGEVLGTLCVIDRQSRQLSPAQMSALEALARQVSALLDARLLAMQNKRLQEEAVAAKDRLQASLDRLSMAHEASGAVSFDWSIEEDSLQWNRDTVFGWPVEQFKFLRSYMAQVHPQDRPALEEAMARAIDDGLGYAMEYRLLALDGQVHWVSISAKPVRNKFGAIDSVLGVNIDITKRRLSDEALLHSEKLAAVGRLASVISHEINNPLEAVTNLLFIVRSSPSLSREDRGHLELADKELSRVSQITAQTLRQNRTVDRPERIEADRIVQELVTLFRSRLAASKIRIKLNLQEGIAFSAYEGDIRQVLNILIANAFDAMRNGGVLQIRSRWATDHRLKRKGVSISVADSGPGVPIDMQSRLFEAFYSTKGLNGIGLGLWTAKRILQKHDGAVTFRSSSGKHHGSVFRLWLPLTG